MLLQCQIAAHSLCNSSVPRMIDVDKRDLRLMVLTKLSLLGGLGLGLGLGIWIFSFAWPTFR